VNKRARGKIHEKKCDPTTTTRTPLFLFLFGSSPHPPLSPPFHAFRRPGDQDTSFHEGKRSLTCLHVAWFIVLSPKEHHTEKNSLLFPPGKSSEIRFVNPNFSSDTMLKTCIFSSSYPFFPSQITFFLPPPLGHHVDGWSFFLSSFLSFPSSRRVLSCQGFRAPVLHRWV